MEAENKEEEVTLSDRREDLRTSVVPDATKKKRTREYLELHSILGDAGAWMMPKQGPVSDDTMSN